MPKASTESPFVNTAPEQSSRSASSAHGNPRSDTVAQTSSSIIQIALASNRNYFFGLAATLLSLLHSNRKNCFCIHIVDGGLSGFQKRFLSKKVKAARRGNAIHFHPLNAASFTGFKPDYGNSYMTYARMLIGSLLDIDRVIYLDTDLLVAADVKPLWDLPLGDHIAAAAPDPTIASLRDDYPFDDVPADVPYFNAGVMVINLVAWRRIHAEEQLLQMIAKAPERFRWWDQTAMNALFTNQITFLEPAWNTFADSINLEQDGQRGIYHYAGKTKPWARYLDSAEFTLWRRFFGRHVLPRAILLSNGKFLWSYLQHWKYRALSRSPLLQRLALRILSIKARLSRKEHSTEIGRFRKRHFTNPPANTTAPKLLESTLKRYMEQRWG